MSISRAILLIAVTWTCLVAGASRLAAQSAPDVIRGTIRAADNTPIPEVTVTAVDSGSSITKQARTDKDGRFTLVFTDGSGDYWISLAAMGYGGRHYELKRNGDEAVLIADAKMTATGVTLAPTRIQGTRQRPARVDSLSDISGTMRSVDLSTIGIDQMGDLNAMISTLPGVTLISADDGSTSGFSVFGLDASQNSYLIDGSASSNTVLPRDTPLSVNLSTSNYDVASGRVGGGQVIVRTRGGTNFASRTMSGTYDTPPLQWTDSVGHALGAQNTHLSVGGLSAGPFALNKRFYSVSYQVDHTFSGLPSLFETSPAGLEAAGLAADSVNRFRSIAARDGIATSAPGLPGSKRTDTGSLFGRMDFTSPYAASGQTLSMTFSGSGNRSTPLGGGSLATQLPSHELQSESENASLSLQHTTYFSFGVLSTTNIGVSASKRTSTPFLTGPSASVLVSSTFDNGTSGIASLAAGGASTTSHSTSASASMFNAMSWFSSDNTHVIKVTTELYGDRSASVSQPNQYGSYTFASLAALNSGTATSFSRQLSPRVLDLSQVAIGSSLGDSWRPNHDVQVVYGVRLDGNRFLTTPQYDPAVAQAFGLRTDHVPDRVYLSPRVGFSWVYGVAQTIGAYQGSARVPRAMLSGGVGVFQNMGTATLEAAQVTGTGLPSAVQQLLCIGSAVPTPDWTAFDSSMASIPDQCADGSAGTVFSSTVPGVSIFDPSYQQPRSIRGNLKWTGAVVGNRFASTVNATYSRNQHQPGSVDLNFSPDVRFALGGEGGRPVYVNPTSIVAGTGAIASHDARVSQLFSTVQEARSDLVSTSRQLSISLSPLYAQLWGLSWSLTYLNGRNEAEQRGFGGNTAGNPLALQWGRGSGDVRHQITGSLGYTVHNAVTVNWGGNLRSGAPYTPMVAGDVNGDGNGSDDRAFVFDPARATDPALAAAMHALLAGGPRSVRECLASQVGQVAARNSCEGPWIFSSQSIAISVPQQTMPLPHRVGVRLQLSNPAGGADLLLHGQNRLHGWGQTPLVQPNLLYVRGFDPSTNQYLYTVNPRFGANTTIFNTLLTPAKLTLVFSLNVGQPIEQQQLGRYLSTGVAVPGRKTPETTYQSMISSVASNPMPALLRAADSLHLTPAQADSIAELNRWYTTQSDSITFPAARKIVALGDHYDAGEAYAIYRDARERTIDLLIRIIPELEGLLTAEQKRLLPASIQNVLDIRYLMLIRSSSIRSGS